MSKAPPYTFIDHISNLAIDKKTSQVRQTGIVCTIGPASNSPEILEQMIENGMNIARLNFSHGTHEYHAGIIKNLQIAVENYRKRYGRTQPIAVALDTKGSEIRTGLLDGGHTVEVLLEKGAEITVTVEDEFSKKGNKNIIFVDYKNITKVVKVGTRIFIDDGLISLICKRIEPTRLICTVENGGRLGSCKGVNLPGIEKDLPTISDKDVEDLKFAVRNNVDMIFASFTRNANEIREIRKILQTNSIRIIAKIENQQGINNMDEIINEADGILIDRGDLGMEIAFQKVFLAQKKVIAKCMVANKPIIIATHLLESMVDKPRPTRAESTDVANAVLDGADCVMLSGETAKGLYPVECVQTMATICKEAEAAFWHKNLFQELTGKNMPPLAVPDALAIAAVDAATNSSSRAIVVVTKTGKSAQFISKYRPNCPIIAVTRNPQVARLLHLYRSILPLYFEGEKTVDWVENVNLRVKSGVDYGKSLGFIKNGDSVVIVTGWKQGAGSTNTMTVVTVE